MLSIDLESILSVKLSPQLSLYQNRACCLTTLTIQPSEGFQSWPTLRFDPYENTIDSLHDILKTLGGWFELTQRGLTAIDKDSNIYYVTDTLEKPISNSRWPSGLPKPVEDSQLFKIGSIGLGVVSSLLGTQTANVPFSNIEIRKCWMGCIGAICKSDYICQG
jgi:hypothetical protein